MFFSLLSNAITSLGEEKANLSAFRTFVRFAFFLFFFFFFFGGFCLFPLPLRVWDGLRLVIVALPGLFSYLFCMLTLPYYSCGDLESLTNPILGTFQKKVHCSPPLG